MRHAVFLFLLHVILVRSTAWGEEIVLPPIVKEGAPGDLLMEDPVLPARAGATRIDAGSGTIQKSLSDALPVPVSGTGLPGNSAQIRGLGRSAEETDVRALGVPLNSPQGGGFDLSVFPQFLWADFRYQMGPALGTYDPRGIAGSLTLTPWSAYALHSGSARALGAEGVGRGRATGFYSTASLAQFSAAVTDRAHAAGVAGYSIGDARGPSGAVSGRWRDAAGRALSAHLLATDLDARTPGPGDVTPEAHQRTIRAIPILQADLPLGGRGLLKSSLFYDWAYLRYDDPSFSAPPATQDRIQLLGFENALLWDAWRFGAGARGVKYQTLSYEDQSEGVLNLSASRAIEWDAWLVEPVVRGVGVSGYGVLPEASLGARREIGGGLAAFARGGVSRRFPSMLNRFYSYPGFPGYPGFAGNPGLRPERAWTALTGVELRSRELEASLQAYGQVAEDAQVRVPLDASTDTMANRGTARVLSLMPSVLARPEGWIDLGASASFSVSRVSETGLAYPALPGALAVLSAGVHPRGDAPAWLARAVLRASSASVADAAGNVLPPYQEVNLDARARVGAAWEVGARLENLFDDEVILVKGFPSRGRTFSLSVSAEL